jgi:hypothetical protein
MSSFRPVKLWVVRAHRAANPDVRRWFHGPAPLAQVLAGLCSRFFGFAAESAVRLAVGLRDPISDTLCGADEHRGRPKDVCDNAVAQDQVCSLGRAVGRGARSDGRNGLRLARTLRRLSRARPVRPHHPGKLRRRQRLQPGSAKAALPLGVDHVPSQSAQAFLMVGNFAQDALAVAR